MLNEEIGGPLHTNNTYFQIISRLCSVAADMNMSNEHLRTIQLGTSVRSNRNQKKKMSFFMNENGRKRER